jgi:hypothetical protein
MSKKIWLAMCKASSLLAFSYRYTIILTNLPPFGLSLLTIDHSSLTPMQCKLTEDLPVLCPFEKHNY